MKPQSTNVFTAENLAKNHWEYLEEICEYCGYPTNLRRGYVVVIPKKVPLFMNTPRFLKKGDFSVYFGGNSERYFQNSIPISDVVEAREEMEK